MSKDPAILFYPSDFLSGTMFFTDEQAGKYIRLLCAQHQNKGVLTHNQMMMICKSYDSEIWSKFQKDADGNYFNERLREEMDKRLKYCESRSLNKKGKVKNSDHMKIICESYDNHMGNRNSIIDSNKEESMRETIPQTEFRATDKPPLTWKDSFEIYLNECRQAFNALYKDEKFVKQQSRLNPRVNIPLTMEKCFLNFWGTEAGWKNKKKSRSKTIDWKATIVNAISSPLNRVYFDKNETGSTITEHQEYINKLTVR